MTRPLSVAVVGHTNTGKTSLLRTLTRDLEFGEVSDSPATTRHVEQASLLVGDRPLLDLFDTPGLEDPIGLLEHLDALRTERTTPWVDVVSAFVTGSGAGSGAGSRSGSAADHRFDQEAKALRQVLASDAALYVIDARDRVLGKYRDELEILGRCARPVVPVMNFVAGSDARTEEWRAALTQVNMHATVAFDTVALDGDSERRLFEALRTLLEPFRETLDALIDDRDRQRRALVRGACELVADALIDVAAYRVSIAEEGDIAAAEADLRDAVRRCEQVCVDRLLELFRFRPEDHDPDVLPITNGQWGLDLFHPESLKHFGVRAGGGAVAGGLAGLTVDAMTGGLSLGAAAALGATAGALWSTFGSHGRRIADRVRGYTEVRAPETAVRLLAVRQIALVKALLRRGHASQTPIQTEPEGPAALAEGDLPAEVLQARVRPEWSRIAPGAAPVSDSSRSTVRDKLAGALEQVVLDT